MCRRDATEFLAFPVLKGGKKIPKEKKKIKISSLHRAQQSTSCSNPALALKELAQVPPFLVFPVSSPPMLPPKKIYFSLLLSASDIPCYHLLNLTLAV